MIVAKMTEDNGSMDDDNVYRPMKIKKPYVHFIIKNIFDRK